MCKLDEKGQICKLKKKKMYFNKATQMKVIMMIKLEHFDFGFLQIYNFVSQKWPLLIEH